MQHFIERQYFDMRKHTLPILLMIIIASLLFTSCGIFHKHTFGEYQYDGIGHFKECSCGYRISESSSEHIDRDRNEACDICGHLMEYEINSLEELSWYLLYYYEMNQYEYLDETNMKFHSIHDMNFKNTITYNESTSRVGFFNEYLTTLPRYEEYVKSNTEYYYNYKISFYSQTNVPADYYSLITQETVQYGLSEQYCDYNRFTETVSKFKTINDFYETVSSSTLTKKIYKDSETYSGDTLSAKHGTVNSVANGISSFIRYYLNVEFTDQGTIVLPEASYFDSVDIRTENDIVNFNIEKNDSKTFEGEDVRYSIEGAINLATYNFSYNMKKSYYIDGELRSYTDYDYDLTLTDDPIAIEFDTDGEFEEIFIENSRKSVR